MCNQSPERERRVLRRVQSEPGAPATGRCALGATAPLLHTSLRALRAPRRPRPAPGPLLIPLRRTPEIPLHSAASGRTLSDNCRRVADRAECGGQGNPCHVVRRTSSVPGAATHSQILSINSAGVRAPTARPPPGSASRRPAGSDPDWIPATAGRREMAQTRRSCDCASAPHSGRRRV